jgi:hypothetical protein
MHHQTHGRQPQGPHWLAGVLASFLVLGVSAAALAQSPTTSPVAPLTEPAPASTEPAPPAFPTTLAGVDLDVRTYTGSEWLAESGDGTPEDAAYAEETLALLESLGRDIDDLAIRSALATPSEGNQAVIVALRIAGVRAGEFVERAVGLLLSDVEEPGFVLRPLGSRWVLRVTDEAIPGVYPRTVYVDGDTAWIIGADEPGVLELLEQLPMAASRTVAEDDMVSRRLPVELEGRRRAGLFETVEPLFLPALADQLGPAFDDWMLDLYLEEGITPTDIVGADAWWGLESSDQSIEVEGYQVPGASPEIVERLRSEIVLAAGEPLPGEVGRSDVELGGHQVTTVDLGSAKRHVLAVGDTVWVVTDHAGEPELAEAAIAALP